MVKIKVIPNIGFSFGEPIKELLRVWSEILKNLNQAIVIDVSGCRFSNPFFLLGIYLLYRRYKQEGVNIELNTNCNNEAFAAYLNLTYFLGGFQPDNYSPEEYSVILDSYMNKTYLPLTNFPSTTLAQHTEVRERILEFISQRVRQRLNLDAQLYSAVTYLIDEAVNNIKDHAQTERGFMFTQFYPKAEYMDLCIADAGVTILGSYQAAGRVDITTDAQAIQAALSGESTKDVSGRGFGIRTSRRMLVNGLGGRFYLMSGNAFLFSHPGENEEIKIFPNNSGLHWNGTYLALRIPVQKNVKFRYNDYLE
jgi:hypothetical protein